ncbi:MAG: flagellin lysine-N-methylase [Desulfobacteraceae bacterium]|jgi:lysine-N-methylase
MQEEQPLLRMPAYLSEFRCIGPECEDHCCYGWDIIVDRGSYEQYRKLPSKGLGKRIRKAVRLNRKNVSEARYARILRKGGTCPFLTPNRLCRIHAELGERFLPDTCAVFPRHLRGRNGWIDITASLACPEIARRALEPPQGLEIIEIRFDPSASGMLRSIEPGPSTEFEAASLMLREAAFALLKDRNHALWRRILALGFLLEKVANDKKRPATEAVPIVLDEFARRMDSGELMDRMDNAPALTGLQLQLVRRLHDEIMPTVVVKTFKACTDECLAGLDYAGLKPFTEDIARRYDASFDQYYRPFFEHYGFMLENYLINYLLHYDLGFHQGRRLYEDYIMMVLTFAMLKTYLIGMAAWHRESFHTTMVTRLIYSFTKVLEPNTRFREYALGLLAQSGCADMTHLAVLIKN